MIAVQTRTLVFLFLFSYHTSLGLIHNKLPVSCRDIKKKNPALLLIFFRGWVFSRADSFSALGQDLPEIKCHE